LLNRQQIHISLPGDIKAVILIAAESFFFLLQRLLANGT
jgi:hypothetical protein